MYLVYVSWIISLPPILTLKPRLCFHEHETGTFLTIGMKSTITTVFTSSFQFNLQSSSLRSTFSIISCFLCLANPASSNKGQSLGRSYCKISHKGETLECGISIFFCAIHIVSRMNLQYHIFN